MKPTARESLQVALGAQKPLEVELLTSEHHRRVTVEAHKAFRESLTPAKVISEIDEFLSELRSIKPEGER